MELLLSRAKLIAGIAILTLLAAVGAHYRHVVNERDQLEVEKTAYKAALDKAAASLATLTEDARLAVAATAAAIAQRDANRAALSRLQAARSEDPEAVAWAAQPIPAGEAARLCEALPEMDGCAN